MSLSTHLAKLAGVDLNTSCAPITFKLSLRDITFLVLV